MLPGLLCARGHMGGCMYACVSHVCMCASHVCAQGVTWVDACMHVCVMYACVRVMYVRKGSRGLMHVCMCVSQRQGLERHQRQATYACRWLLRVQGLHLAHWHAAKGSGASLAVHPAFPIPSLRAQPFESLGPLTRQSLVSKPH